MSLSPEPKSSKSHRKSKRPTTSKYTGSFQTSTATIQQPKESERAEEAKGEEAKSSRSITLGTEADPIKRPQEREKRERERKGKRKLSCQGPERNKNHVPKRIEPSNMERTGDMRTIHQRPHAKRDLTTVRTELKEFTLVSFNVRGLNGEAKQ